jgi:isoleucyl-tRNA synthetase
VTAKSAAKRSAKKKFAKANPRSKGSTKAKTAQRAAKAAFGQEAKAKAKPRVLSASAKPREAQRPQSLMARLEAQALKVQTGRDWSATLFLPKTDFPMKAGLPEREPELFEALARDATLRPLARGGDGSAEIHPP